MASRGWWRDLFRGRSPERAPRAPASPGVDLPDADGVLPDADGVLLAELARTAVAARVSGAAPPSTEGLPRSVGRRQGVFVTLESPAGHLRGCLGTIEGGGPLAAETVRLAGDAATEDHRFAPLEVGELAALRVKVSVLSPLVTLEARGPEALVARLVPGRDGVLLELPAWEGRSVYLPEVWAKLENDPDLFLGSLCEKQGAPPTAWRDRFREARFRVFRTRAWYAGP